MEKFKEWVKAHKDEVEGVIGTAILIGVCYSVGKINGRLQGYGEGMCDTYSLMGELVEKATIVENVAQ